jgi:mRNA-degrading endonuclease RelE of RelBE toxin-antitoxin system
MSYYVEFTSKATDGLEKLTSAIQERILSKIRWLSKILITDSPLTLTSIG